MKFSLISSIVLIIVLSTITLKAQDKQIPGALVHTVLFWLKNPDNPSDRIEFEKGIKVLIATNPQGIMAHIGRPATTKPREVVDDSFTYQYVMTFASVEDEEAYQTDPTHTDFVKKVDHLIEKVIVYDSLSIP